MPRHNRRAPQSAPPIRKLSAADRASLAGFAREHIAAHADAVDAHAELDDRRGADFNLCVTGSEHPPTGIRFLSAGEHVDRVAIRLAGASPSPSDGGGNLAT